MRFRAVLPWMLGAAVGDLVFLPLALLLLHHSLPTLAHGWWPLAPWATWTRALHLGLSRRTWGIACAIPFGIALWWYGMHQLDTTVRTARPRAASPATAGMYGSAAWRTPAQLDRTFVRWPEPPKETARRQPQAMHRGEPPTPPAGLVLGGLTETPPPAQNGVPGFRAWVLHRDENAMIFGPTRAGKTRKVLLPTLYVLGQAGESMVVNDPKDEINPQVAGWLHARGYQVIRADLRTMTRGYVWAPDAPEPAEPFRWNPLAVARAAWATGETSVSTQWVTDVVQGLLTTQMKANGENSFWDGVAQSALTGLALAMLQDAPADACHIPTLQYLLSLPDETVDAWFAQMPAHALAPRLASTYLKTHGESRTNANAYTLRMLQSLISPELEWMLSGETFHPLAFADPTVPVALFLVIPEQRSTVDPLATLLIHQLLQVLGEEAAKLPSRRLPHRMNLVLDEFGNLPAIPSFDKTVSVGLSRGIRLMLAVQNIGQLARYDEPTRKTILGNCGTWLCLGAENVETAQEISQRIGQYDYAYTTRQHSGGTGGGPAQLSWGQQTVGRALLTPDEVMRWPVGHGLVLQQRENAARTKLPDLSYWGVPWARYPSPTPLTTPAPVRLWPDSRQHERLPGNGESPPATYPNLPSDTASTDTEGWDPSQLDEYVDLPF